MYFSKMHGLSNDFMVVNCINQDFHPTSITIKELSNRYTGIGFDQLLLVEKTHNSLFDFNYRIFNANGNEVEQCGNGARCFGLFLLLKQLTNKEKISVSTKKRRLIIYFINNNLIKVNMEEPDFKLDNIELSKNILCKNFSVNILNDSLTCSIVSIGNPHCVITVQNIKNAPVNIIGNTIEKKSIFLQGINVGFMQIINRNYIKLRVYERDVGETQSCGTGACAAVAVGIAKNLLANKVKVDLLGGTLIIEWKGLGHPLYMIGPAQHVYDGYIYI
ncbi:diaminopimelate epimerase [Buchnera aphidicola]|uniref:diaminopimelate epimerase n=1 Tax=Buchnera aphidicola TaxID=9 RepID=UPI001C9D8A51|nr:diaminopimelate epimerase [Buchnera aphidicola]